MDRVEEINKAIEGLSLEDQLKISVGGITIQSFFAQMAEMSEKMAELRFLLTTHKTDE